jgi:FKBP-type peptidyl-prolyl cis-trans isomerase FkpA
MLLAAAAPLMAPTPPLVTASGIRIETLEPGLGAHPAREGAVRVELEVRLPDGTVVDGPAAPVGLSVSGVIPGMTEALLLMKQGGRYRIWIPARLAYGKQGNADGSVPPNSDLVFTVRLLAVGRVANAR